MMSKIKEDIFGTSSFPFVVARGNETDCRKSACPFTLRVYIDH